MSNRQIRLKRHNLTEDELKGIRSLLSDRDRLLEILLYAHIDSRLDVAYNCTNSITDLSHGYDLIYLLESAIAVEDNHTEEDQPSELNDACKIKNSSDLELFKWCYERYSSIGSNIAYEKAVELFQNINKQRTANF